MRNLILMLLALLFTLGGAYAQALDPASDDRSENISPPSRAGYIRGFSVTGSGSAWSFMPFDIKGNDEDGTSDWSRVPTKEKYQLSPVGFYGIHGILETADFNLRLSYERGHGYDIGLSDSSLLALLFQLTGIRYLDRIKFGSTALDFVGGEALLVDRVTEEVYDETYFELHLRRFSMSYQLKRFHLMAQYLGYTIPRNIYLKETTDVGETQAYTYYPISDTLLRVDTRVFMLGAGIDNRKHIFKDGYLQPYRKDQSLVLGAHFLLGGGSYELRDLFFDRHLDEGHAIAVGLNGHLRWEHQLWSFLTIGTTLDVSLYLFSPIGLPKDLDREARSEGIPTDRLSIDFGTVDVMGRLYGFARIDF